MTNILPMNLMWSYQDNKNEMLSIVPVISPRMERFCDFIFVNPVQCYFRTEVTVPVGHTRNDTLTSGKYIANLFISTSNFKSVEYCIIFRYTKYNEDHGETIKEIKCYRIRWYHKLFEYIGMLFHNLLFK